MKEEILKYFSKESASNLEFLRNNKPANQLVTDLKNHPHAFVLACQMNRQMDSNLAWQIPYEIQKELKTFEIQELHKSKKRIKNIFKTKRIHIYYNDFGELFCQGVDHIIKYYDGNARKIWNDNPSSATVIRRFLEIPGFGPKIATNATNLLYRDFKIKFSDGRRNIDISPDTHVIRVAIRTGFLDTPNISKISDKIKNILIYKARELNPDYPGIFDYNMWYHGKHFCKKKDPNCPECPLNSHCPKIGLGRGGKLSSSF